MFSLLQVQVLLGPVVGKVTHDTAIVLLEVDAAAIVTCVVTGVLEKGQGGDAHRFTQRQPGRRPRVFVIPGLMPERRYVEISS